jgi:S1-C subfamily serine protease
MPTVPERGLPPRKILERAREATVAFVALPAADIDGPPKTDGSLPEIIGTGFALEEDPRIVVTAAHVVAGAFGRASELSVLSAQAHRPGILWECSVEDEADQITSHYSVAPTFEFRTRQGADVAVVRLPEQGEPPPSGLPLADPSYVHLGDRVATCGWPYGTTVQEDDGAVVPSFTWGTVSNIRPHPESLPDERTAYLVQMPVNPGNSGGAVFTANTGEAMGVVVSMMEVRGVRAGLAQVLPVTLFRPGIDYYIQNR